MIENQNIICFSSVDWTSYQTSKIYLMKIMSRRNRVLYVETLGSKTPGLYKSHLYRMARRIFRWLKGPTRPSDAGPVNDILIYSPLIIPIHNSRFIRKMNFYILRWTFRRLIKRLNFRNPILWFYLPTAADLIGQLGEAFSLYHCVDDWLTYPGYRNSNFEDLERKLFKDSDAVFISNRLLFDKKKVLNKNTYYLPHAVEFEHYQKIFSADEPLPTDMASLSRPIIAMVGEVAGWVNWDFLKYAAESNPKWSIAMLGPVGYDANLREVKDISNIYFLGYKEYSQLPNYYRAIDVCVVSFNLDEHIKYCTPTRFYEHLAAGKPIVSTDFPTAREFPEEHVKLARTKEEFVELIKSSLDENSEELERERMELARANTWAHRAEYISDIIGRKSPATPFVRKIRVLHIITRLCAGGAREVLLKIIDGLDKSRYDVTLLCGPQDFVMGSAQAPQVKTVVIAQLVRRINPIKDLVALIKLYLFIKRGKFDIVHTHTSKAGILGRTAAKLSKVPIIFHIPHGSIFHPIYFRKCAIFILRKIERIAALYTDRIIVGSDNEREDFLHNGIGNEGKYVRIPYYFIREGAYDVKVDKQAKKKELNVPDGHLLLANIARLVPEKGHIFCLEAFRKVIDEVPNVLLLIVGEGYLRKAIEKKISELNLQKNVILTGFREDIPQILSITDISLHTSLWEGTPLSIVEAMSLGKAIIATRVGGIPEIIKDGTTGILVQPQNVDELAKWIIRLSSDRTLLSVLGREAKEYARQKFDSKAIINEINNLYDTFLKMKASDDVS